MTPFVSVTFRVDVLRIDIFPMSNDIVFRTAFSRLYTETQFHGSPVNAGVLFSFCRGGVIFRTKEGNECLVRDISSEFQEQRGTKRKNVACTIETANGS